MADLASLNINKLAKEITVVVKLKGLKVFGFRRWVGCKLIILAVKIIGCGIRIEND